MKSRKKYHDWKSTLGDNVCISSLYFFALSITFVDKQTIYNRLKLINLHWWTFMRRLNLRKMKVFADIVYIIHVLLNNLTFVFYFIFFARIICNMGAHSMTIQKILTCEPKTAKKQMQILNIV